MTLWHNIVTLIILWHDIVTTMTLWHDIVIPIIFWHDIVISKDDTTYGTKWFGLLTLRTFSGLVCGGGGMFTSSSRHFKKLTSAGCMTV